MTSLADSILGRLLAPLARAVCRRPRWFVWPQIVLFGVCVWYTWSFLEIDFNRNNLVGKNKKYHRNYLEFKKEFPAQDDIVVVVESEAPEKNRQFIERLGVKLEAETNLFTDVFYKGDLKMLGAKALMFVPDQSATTLAAGDLKDLPALAARLREPPDAVSAYLRSRLSAATIQTLASYPGAGGDSTPLVAALTNELNSIVTGPLIFETQHFAGVTLRPETQRLLTQSLDLEKRSRLNRLLLEDACPTEIARSDLEELLRTLRDYRPFIQQFAGATNLTALFNLINTRFGTAKREDNAENRSLLGALPMLERIVREGADSLARPGLPPSPGVAALFNAGPEAEEQIYITFDHARIYLVTARPRLVEPQATPLETDSKQNERNADSVRRLRELVEQTKFEVPGLNVGITGEPVLEQDEMVQSKSDSVKASIVSLIVCALIFIYGYKETGRPIKATFCLVIGLGYTMAFTTATVGHLNILTITFVPILIGLAIDFGVHLITRYEEELRRGASEEAALTKAMVFTGQGIFTGALTTAAAFWAMAITDFKGIQEMGIICGGGIVVCLVPMMTMLPGLLLGGRQNVLDHAQPDPALDRRARIEQFWLQRPLLVTLVTTGLVGLALMMFPRVYFDYNLLNMQSKGLPAVELEKKLINAASKSVIFAAVIATNAEHAVAVEARLKQMPTVASVDSMSQYLTDDPERVERKLALIGEIKAQIAPIRFADTDPAPVQIEELSRTLWSLQGYLGAAGDDVKTNEPALHQQLLSLRDTIGDLRRAMLAGDVTANAERLALYQRALFDDIRETFAALRDQDNRSGMKADDLPLALRNRFIGISGEQLLQVYPRKDVWQRENQVEFVTELRRALDPNDTNTPIITGTPVQLLEYTTLLKSSYETAAWYALAAISIMVLAHFRSLGSLVLALLPVAIGAIWMGGLMGLFGLPFNPANIMTLPLVIGIGVTNGIHILNRYAEEHSPSILAVSTGKAVLVSGLTTIAGFGSLMLAKHQGIKSLGYVMSIGVAMCMLAGLTFLPALLNLLRGKQKPDADSNARTGLGGTEVKKPQLRAEM